MNPPRNMAQRLAAIAQRLGLGNADLHKVSQRTRSLALSFSAPASPPSGIGWQSGAPLYRLIDLPRGALSGPVQEDKARAHAALKKLVGSRLLELHDVDLREVDGLCTRGPLANSALPDFEAVAAGDAGRKVRIISYRDFGKALGQALSGFERGVELQLRRADWHGQRLFLELDNHTEAFACAVAYARRRGLELRRRGLDLGRASVGGIGRGARLARLHVGIAHHRLERLDATLGFLHARLGGGGDLGDAAVFLLLVLGIALEPGQLLERLVELASVVPVRFQNELALSQR